MGKPVAFDSIGQYYKGGYNMLEYRHSLASFLNMDKTRKYKEKEKEAGKYHYMTGLKFYNFGFNCCTPHKYQYILFSVQIQFR